MEAFQLKFYSECEDEAVDCSESLFSLPTHGIIIYLNAFVYRHVSNSN